LTLEREIKKKGTIKPASNSSLANQLAGLEAILFVAGEAVNLADLSRALEVEPGWLEELIETLNGDYEAQGRGLRIYRHNQQVQLVTAPEAAPFVERFMGAQTGSKLSAAALESLIIIAYRQPITRQGVEAIRGVDSSGVINTLQARGLIEEVGRAETVGHPVLFGTTFDFLHYFGLKSLKDLPPLEGLQPSNPD
jgi:segregation and condensation protein B